MEFITGKHLSRRTFVRGMGTTVALPLLDAMVPAGRGWSDPTADTTATRLVCIEMVHGSAGSNEYGASRRGNRECEQGRSAGPAAFDRAVQEHQPERNQREQERGGEGAGQV